MEKQTIIKIISKVAAVFAAVIFAMVFSGCAAPDALSDSTYEYSSSSQTYTFNFERGGKFKLSQSIYGSTLSTVSGTYSVAGSEATLKADGGVVYNLSTSNGWETFKYMNLTFRRK